MAVSAISTLSRESGTGKQKFSGGIPVASLIGTISAVGQKQALGPGSSIADTGSTLSLQSGHRISASQRMRNVGIDGPKNLFRVAGIEEVPMYRLSRRITR